MYSEHFITLNKKEKWLLANENLLFLLLKKISSMKTVLNFVLNSHAGIELMYYSYYRNCIV